MCGITGIVHPDALAPDDVAHLAHMSSALVHRGPDEHGEWTGRQSALAMRRLAIIDLAGGQQPIFSEDRQVVLVFNGEIYNFRTLREQLQKRGHLFRSATDAEVIVHLYEDFGPDCVNHLVGMFALAIWDERAQTLWLARDRLGVKPLYYYCDDRRLLFGSEIKALLADPHVPRDINLSAIDELFSLGYIGPPHTAFRQILQLPPASRLRYRHGKIQIEQYWDVQIPVDLPPYDERRAIGELEDRLDEAIRCRLISDVPLGAFLSGGIDSSTIVAMMARHCSSPVQTFSIGFRESSFSELPSAKLLADHAHTDHHEFIVDADVESLLPTLIRHYDEPFYDTSAIPTYHVSRLARQYVTVALSGDGGDELFAGYNFYLANKLAVWLQRTPAWIRRYLLEPLASRLPESERYVNYGRVARELLRGVSLTTQGRYARWTAKVKDETRTRLYRDPLLISQLRLQVEDRLTHLFARVPQASSLAQLLYVELHSTLPHDMLTKVDRMSMACSLEVRSPLLDHRLHEWSAQLPDRAKLRGWKSKYLLRQVAARHIPSPLLRKPKRGFAIPLDRWLRRHLAPFVKEILLDDMTRQRGYFDPLVVHELIDQHLHGKISFGRELWILLTIELWQRMYLDQRPAIAANVEGNSSVAEDR